MARLKSIIFDLFKSRWIFILLFFLVALFTNMRQNVVTNYNCEICSDKAGYFMYLPASFYYGFNASEFPENSDVKTGNGFHLDYEKNIVVTKFTIGVAAMQAPFYGIGFLIDKVFSLRNTPFSKYYLVWVSIGSSFYLVLGLFYLHSILAQFYSKKTAKITALLCFFGTNLLYYTIDENLMSHLYSFTLCCLLIFTLIRFIRVKNQLFYIITLAVYALAILVRPTNALFGPLALGIAMLSNGYSLSDLLKLITINRVLIGLMVFLILFTPQMVYWKYAFDNWVVWSYDGESFSNAATPFFFEVWFSPQGGLFTYTPILFLSIIVGVYLVFSKKTIGWIVLITFLTVSYLCASWHTPFFGECNFGKRPFVEFYSIMMFPIAFLIEKLQSNKALQKPIWFIILLFVYFNLSITGVFDTCFYGEIWGWNAYFEMLGKGLILIR